MNGKDRGRGVKELWEEAHWLASHKSITEGPFKLRSFLTSNPSMRVLVRAAIKEGRRTIPPRLRREYKIWLSAQGYTENLRALKNKARVSNEEIVRPKQSGSVTNRTRGFVPVPASQKLNETTGSPKKPSAQARDELDSRSVRVVLDFQQFIAKWSGKFERFNRRYGERGNLVRELGGMAKELCGEVTETAINRYSGDVAMKDICFFRFLAGISELLGPGDFLNDFLYFVHKHELTMGDLLILTGGEFNWPSCAPKGS